MAFLLRARGLLIFRNPLEPTIMFYIKIGNDDDPCKGKYTKIVRQETREEISASNNECYRDVINIGLQKP